MTRGVLWPVQPAETGFRTRSSVEESREQRRLVAQAVGRAKQGDREAVRFLYVNYSHNVYSYVRSIVRDEHDAEDITQHVFAKLMTVVERYEPRGVPFVAWLLRLAHNVAIDHLRSRRATPAEEVFASDERADDAAADRRRTLRDALAALPSEQRNVILLRHVLGLTPGEIADRLGRTESSIHGLHHRGRRALREELVRLESAPSVGARIAA
jgi:RNA polymerase sigma-70 factor (ECF subfamily)